MYNIGLHELNSVESQSNEPDQYGSSTCQWTGLPSQHRLCAMRSYSVPQRGWTKLCWRKDKDEPNVCLSSGPGEGD